MRADDKARSQIEGTSVGIRAETMRFAAASSATSEMSLARLPLHVKVGVSEPAQVLLRATGEANSASMEARADTYETEQIVEVDLLERAIVSQRVKLNLWAVDKAQNSMSLGECALAARLTAPL